MWRTSLLLRVLSLAKASIVVSSDMGMDMEYGNVFFS
jgi:hypothetical protein